MSDDDFPKKVNVRKTRPEPRAWPGSLIERLWRCAYLGADNSQYKLGGVETIEGKLPLKVFHNGCNHQQERWEYKRQP